MTENPTRLDGEVAVVTGGASGVGRGIALELGARGASVVVSDIDDEGGAQTVAAITDAGGTAAYVHADVRNADELRLVVETAQSQFGPVTTAVVSVMAGNGGGRIWEHDLADVRAMFDVFVFGTFSTVHTFGPALIDTARSGRAARLLLVGSEHSLGVPPHVFAASAYTTAKYATLGIADTARRDFEGTGVSVTLLTPSWVRTEKVLDLVRSSPELAQAIEPHAQNTRDVARAAVDGLLRGDYITATNPVMRAFVIEHARDVMTAVQMLPEIAEADYAHDGTGDASRCPVIGHF
ncbi:SDR family NAD(P)-dependent oxidoreductase [Cryptosporangium aurantiacum]|uniref:NAD(P)-dependent dehydrogenase, short-chain alcohol dehydrogenase family n=1 Tax=Cryptosporangium aurantiacum TaxID=134849 RepID=A0A1M7RP02_9ACTN|nr:SDR family oxidoreductase [Cryptosporangium aurantiacum]SHN47931.1 NAD(P)-dependent dehydrogenase, short-chain alcohol dehydrogenase family [Cryptosporangium aurantiacum]